MADDDELSDALVPLATKHLQDKARKEVAADLEGGPKKKSILIGVGLGFILPGVGLFYSAPWLIAIVATLMAVAFYWISSIPLIGGGMGAAFVLLSGVAGGLFAREHNKQGKRAHLPLYRKPKQLPAKKD